MITRGFSLNLGLRLLINWPIRDVSNGSSQCQELKREQRQIKRLIRKSRETEEARQGIFNKDFKPLDLRDATNYLKMRKSPGSGYIQSVFLNTWDLMLK